MHAGAVFRYSHTIGFLANQGRGFNNPVDLALDSQGVMYVLNRAGPEVGTRLSYKRVSRCTVDQEYLGEFGTGGTGDGEIWWPSSLAFDSQDRLYVADEALDRISVFSREGQFLEKWGAPGNGPGQLNRPSYLAFDQEDNLYVSDSLNHRVQKFTRDGQFLSQWGSFGDGPGQFNMPWGLALDGAGQVYVADWRNDRVQKFTPEGRFLAQWGTSGNGPGQLHRPAAVAVDGEGNLYVADWGNDSVQVLAPDGPPLAVLHGDAAPSAWAGDYFAANPDEAEARSRADLEPVLHPAPRTPGDASASIERLFWGPTAVKLDGHGRLYVVDSCRHRIQVFCDSAFSS